jgi:hypothetical protein
VLPGRLFWTHPGIWFPDDSQPGEFQGDKSSGKSLQQATGHSLFCESLGNGLTSSYHKDTTKFLTEQFIIKLFFVKKYLSK